VCTPISFLFLFFITNIIYCRIEQQIVAAGTSVAPPARPARSQTTSVLPPAPTVSTSRARVDREPKITAAKAITPSDSENGSSDSDSSDKSQDHSNDQNTNSGSGTDDNSGSDVKEPASPVRIGPPSRSKQKQHSEPGTATANISDHGTVDVKMHSPPHAPPSQRGRARNVKAIGSSSRSQPAKSSGASRAYGATIGGKALGNTPNIGDFDSGDDDMLSVNVEGTVNLFPSNTRPTTMDIDETAVIGVTIPYEGDLAHLLQSVAKYYSPMSGMYLKFYFKFKVKLFDL